MHWYRLKIKLDYRKKIMTPRSESSLLIFHYSLFSNGSKRCRFLSFRVALQSRYLSTAVSSLTAIPALRLRILARRIHAWPHLYWRSLRFCPTRASAAGTLQLAESVPGASDSDLCLLHGASPLLLGGPAPRAALQQEAGGAQ